MVVYIIILAVLILAAVAVILYILHGKKYDEFLQQNSVALNVLNKINNKYSFTPCKNYDMSHTYDNENFYGDISCRDYLIYQLQYIGGKVSEQIKQVKLNNDLYSKYLAEVGDIDCFGQFRAPIGRLKREKLLKKEGPLIKEATLKPPVDSYAVKVTLRCSNINGDIRYIKSQYFSSQDILLLIKRLKNKKGTFYNDRDIWDAICRVERGKVSNKMRFAIYKRDGYRCCRCGVSQKYAALEVDHIIPIAHGGKSTFDNLQTLCHNCNVAKGDTVY